MDKKKVLLMGRSGSGKTSMRSIIFANYLPRDTSQLAFTVDIEHSHVKFLGSLVLNLWDCGGQDAYMDSYFNNQKDQIFRNVQVLIFLFDIESREHAKDLRAYRYCLDALQENSPEAEVFCLIHKMDLVPEDQREQVFRQRENELRQMSSPFNPKAFPTSIWDATLYKAWSDIVHSMIPNITTIEYHLSGFCDACEADEVVLFESASFLKIASSSKIEHSVSATRFEQISNAVKQFKLSCSKASTQMKTFQVTKDGLSIFVSNFTSTTYIMIVISKPLVSPTLALTNIDRARSHFEIIFKAPEPSF